MHPSSTCFLGPIRVHKTKSISIGSAIFAQLTAECHWTCLGMSFTLKIAPSHRPTSNTWFLEHTSQQPKQQLDRSSRFCTDHRKVSLYFTMAHPFLPQNCPFPWGDVDSHLVHGSLGPLESFTQTTSRFSRCCRLTTVTDRPTDRPRY